MPTKAAVQSADNQWAVSYSSDLRYYTWRNTFGNPFGGTPGAPGKGSQFYAPMSLSIVGAPDPNWKLEFVVRGGYVSAEQRTPGEHGSVSTPTDTQLSTTVTYTGLNGIQPYVAMLVNAPTGKSALYGSARFARMDGDLVEIGSYGEGWNFGPTVGVNIPITPSLIATLTFGHTYRGAFDKEGTDPITFDATATDRVRNGGDTTVTAGLGYSDGPVALQASVSEAWNDVTQVNNPGDFNYQRYRAGRRTTVTGSATYTWNPQWSANLNGFWTHAEKNDVLDATGTVLIPETFNSNSDVYRVNAGVTYTTAMGIGLGPVASYTYRNHNYFDPTTFGFLPGKTRWSAGGQASYNVTNRINLNGRVEKVWIREYVNPGPPAFAPLTPDQSGDAWQFTLGATFALLP